MSKAPWRDDNLRQEAEQLISSYGHLWPTRCEHPKCTSSFPRSFKKDQAKSGSFTVRRFRCSGCKTTLSVNTVLATLRPVQQDPTAASAIVSAIMQQPFVLLSAPSSQPKTPSGLSRQTIPLNQSIHMSDLDSVHEDDDMSDVNSNDNESVNVSSPLVHYVDPHPDNFHTQGSAPRILATLSPTATQVFSSPLPSQIPYWSSPSHQSVYPSQLSPWSGGFQTQPHLMFQPQPSAPQSPSMHPSQWSYMSGASLAPTLTQVPPTQVVPASSPAPPATPQVQAPEFRASPQAESSTAAGKRRHMEASTWLQKQPRLDASYHMPPDHSAAIQQALDNSDRTAQQLMAANQNLQSQLQALVAEVSQLRKELQDSHQALAAAKVATMVSQPAIEMSSLPTTATPAVPMPQPPPAKPTETAPLPQAVIQVTPVIEPEPVVHTYAGAARQGLTEAQLAVIQSMRPPPRPFKARQPSSATPKPDSTPVHVYFSGVQSGPLKVFKERLRALRIRTSQIYNISFVGKTICEFLVDATYQAKFTESMTSFTFRHLPNFDPAVPQDPNVTPETRDLLKQAYTRRLTAMASTTNRGFVRDVFLSMLSASGSPMPTDLPDLTVPAASVLPAGTSVSAATSEPASDETTITKDPAAEDSAGTIDGGKTAPPPACDPTPLSSSSHE